MKEQVLCSRTSEHIAGEIKLKDGDVKMACGAACSTNAITFGDVNDKNSKIRKKLQVEKIL